MTEPVRPYALDYGSIIAIGIPFMIFIHPSTASSGRMARRNMPWRVWAHGRHLQHRRRSDFYIRFGLGIKGAALATILGQFISFLISISYLRKFRSIVLSKRDLIPCRKIFKVLGYGVSSFITQMTIVVVMVFNNNLLRKYGVLSRFGAEIPAGRVRNRDESQPNLYFCHRRDRRGRAADHRLSLRGRKV